MNRHLPVTHSSTCTTIRQSIEQLSQPLNLSGTAEVQLASIPNNVQLMTEKGHAKPGDLRTFKEPNE